MFLLAIPLALATPGDDAWAAGNHAAALTAWGKDLQSARTAGDVPRQIDLLVRLAAGHRDLGRVSSARAFLDEATRLSPNDPAPIIGRGLVELSAGNARSAEHHFETAFHSAKATDPRLAMDAANDLGLARAALGKRDEAKKAYDVAIAAALAMNDNRTAADALVNRGLLARRHGDFPSARADLTDAQTRFRTAGDEAGEIDATANLGLVWQDLGDLPRAKAAYEAALSRAQSRKDLRRQATLLQNIGTLLHPDPAAAEWYTAAERAWNEAGFPEAATGAALDRAMLGKPDAATLRALMTRAGKDRRLEATIALNLALLSPSEAPALLAKVRALPFEDLLWRADYVEGTLNGDTNALKRAVDRIERSPTDDDPSLTTRPRDAYEALVDARARAGDAKGALLYAQQAQLRDSPTAPAVLSLVASTDESRWLTDALGTAQDEQAELLRNALASQRVAFSQQVDALRDQNPDLARHVRIDPEDIEAIQAELPPGVVVVQPILLPTRIVVLAISRTTIVARDSTALPADVETDALVLGRVMRGGGTPDAAWIDARTTALGEALLRPVADVLAGADVLAFCLEGVLRQIPFSMLRLDGDWLASRSTVVNITSVASLQRTLQRFRLTGKEVLLVGNPDGTLPGAEREVHAIAATLGGGDVLVGAQGSRDALRTSTPGHTTVHLATHGVVDWQSPNASYLVLAGYPGAEGRLAYAEIPGLAPWIHTVRMVVLSACNSGLPATSYYGTGSINGLAAQFHRAGVETLVASLWPVSDDGTEALMTAFYQEIAGGEDVGHAMRNAQRKLIAGGAWSDPYYWAPFVVVGDWR